MEDRSLGMSLEEILPPFIGSGVDLVYVHDEAGGRQRLPFTRELIPRTGFRPRPPGLLLRGAAEGHQTLLQHMDDFHLLVVRQLWVHRQGEDFRRDALGYREIALTVAKAAIGLL